MALLDMKVIYHADESRQVTLVMYCKVETDIDIQVRHNLLQDIWATASRKAGRVNKRYRLKKEKINYL